MIYLLFNPRGRIGRAAFLGYGFFAQVILQLVSSFTWIFFGGRRIDLMITESGDQAFVPEGEMGRLWVLYGVQFSLLVVILWVVFCLNAKRVHDVGKGYPGWPINVITGALMGLQALEGVVWPAVAGLAAVSNFLLWLVLVALPGNLNKNNHGWPRSGIKPGGVT